MLIILITVVFVVALMIGINALYVAGEFAAVSARKGRIAQAANEGSRLAKMMLPILEDHHRLDNYIAASQVGITLSSIVLGIYGQQQIAPLISPLLEGLPFIGSEVAALGIASLLVLFFLTALQVVLGELVPKSLALQYPERVALATAVPMRWSADIILKPLIVLLNGSGTLILRLLGVKSDGGHQHIHSPEEIMLLIGESHAGGLIDADERELLDNAFRVGELTAGEIVVPRTRMMAVPKDKDAGEMLHVVAESGFTRVPVYENTIDQIIGFVHLKELFRLYHTDPHASIESILRKPSYVPETTSLNELWNILDRDQTYMAIVIDEYGGTLGMLTREDVIEEVFGEVQDEFDLEKPPVVALGQGQYLVRGDVLINHLNHQLDIDMPDDEANTIGGLLLYETGHIPTVGEEAIVGGVRLRVKAATDRTIEEVHLTLPDDTPDTSAEGEG